MSTTTTHNRSLYAIGEDKQALEDLLYEVGGDITDDQVEAAIAEWLDEIEADTKAKADNYVGLIRNMEARAAARKAEADRMATLARTEQAAADRLKDRLKNWMIASDTPKIETDHFRITVAKNGGKLPVDILEGITAADLPEEYQRVKYEIDIDKERIREDLEAGKTLDFASLGQRGTRLSIK